MTQNINKEKNNKFLLIISITSIALAIISIIINILWFQFFFNRSLIIQQNILDLRTKFDTQFRPEHTKEN